MSKIITFSLRNQRPICYGLLLTAYYATLAGVFFVEAAPVPQVTEISATAPEADTDNEIPEPVETTTAHFLSYLFQREGVRDPWVAQLVKAAAPVLAEEGIGGVIRQSFKVGPALALGAFNALANQRIGPLLNLPTIPTTTVIPPYKRYRDFE